MRRAYHRAGTWYLEEGTCTSYTHNEWTWKVINQCPDSPEAYGILRGWGALNFVTRADEPIPEALKRNRTK